MNDILLGPVQGVQKLLQGDSFAWVRRDTCKGAGDSDYVVSHESLRPLLTSEHLEWHRHEALVLAQCGDTHVAIVAIHRTCRGAATGGVRRGVQYANVAACLNDVLLLSRAMSRKNALAGLNWGGGKAVIVDCTANRATKEECDRSLHQFGALVSRLRGVFHAAVADIGMTSQDAHQVSRQSRFVTCLPVWQGGSGDPSAFTGTGVACALLSALHRIDNETATFDFFDLAQRRRLLEKRSVILQGFGGVGAKCVDVLSSAGAEVTVLSRSDPSARCTMRAELLKRPNVTLRIQTDAPTAEQLAQFDVFVPCAVGGVLTERLAHELSQCRGKLRLVCGGANNQLASLQVSPLLAQAGVVYVPDLVANRLGICRCAEEAFGSFADPMEDPASQQHFDPTVETSLPRTVWALMENKEDTQGAAMERAEILAEMPHPLFGKSRYQALLRAVLSAPTC
ncbi:MAG: hypothetical protein MHM6MM_004792 [Cercozoa sp. M6MM]